MEHLLNEKKLTLHGIAFYAGLQDKKLPSDPSPYSFNSQTKTMMELFELLTNEECDIVFKKTLNEKIAFPLDEYRVTIIKLS